MSQFRFLTGSYTEPDLFPGSTGEGVRVWELDSGSGTLSPVSTFDEISNPSWVSVAPVGNLVAVASEQINGSSKVCLLSVSPDGRLRLTASQSAGDATCHVSFSPDGKLLASAAYVAGEAQLISVEGDSFRGNSYTHRYEGRGPNPERQEAPHAHHAVFSPDSRVLYVTDLGTDRIWAHHIDNGTLRGPAFWVGLPAGEGPRHMVVDWKLKRAYLLAELTGRLHTLSLDPTREGVGGCHTVAALPGNWEAAPSAAAVRMHPERPYLYVSHRNGGLIAAFRVSAGMNQLESIGFFTTEDPSPRDFNISPDGRWLLVAGQETHRISVHPVEIDSGKIGPSVDSVECGSPVCLEWFPAGEKQQ